VVAVSFSFAAKKDRSGGHVKCNKTDTERQVLHVLFCKWRLKVE
jgi:hypothetical protein